MRKLASQVPESVSRLLGSSYLKQPPTWYTPVLSNPPPIQPARSTVNRHTRTSTGTEIPMYSDTYPHRLNRSTEGKTRTHQMKHLREKKPRVEPIVYEEDRVRRRFFADFPFEALRPTSLVEGRELGEEDEVKGREWTRLDQRGHYPTVENVVAFTLNLHHTFKQPISEAYEAATSQFVDLRARHEMATLAAEAEARAYGAQFKRDPFERVHAKEQQSLSSLATYTTSSASTAPSSKYKKPARWSASVPTSFSQEFSAGQGYVAKWRLPPPLSMGQPAGQQVEGEVSAVQETSAEGNGATEMEEIDDDEFIRRELARPVPARA